MRCDRCGGAFIKRLGLLSYICSKCYLEKNLEKVRFHILTYGKDSEWVQWEMKKLEIRY